MFITSLYRIRAFGIHLLASLCIAAFAAALIFFVWYPGTLASASGVNRIFFLLIGVDVVLGPLITLIIFNPQKKELRRDLAIVVFIQIAALLYGMHIMFSVRPAFIVFNADRFDVVYANELTDEALAVAKDAQFRSRPLWGPQVVAARLPDNKSEAEKIILSAISGEADLQHMPEFYQPYEKARAEIQKSIKPLNAVSEYNKDKLDLVDALHQQYAAISDKNGYIPLMAKTHNLVVVVNRETTEIISMVNLRPLDESFGVNSLDLKSILEKARH